MRGSTGTRNYLKQNVSVSMTDSAILEMNMNRYAEVVPPADSIYGSNAKDQAYYKEKFPLSSVTLPNRPRSGICKPRFGKYSFYWPNSGFIRDFTRSAVYDSSGDYYTFKPRFYYVGPADDYKYFASAVKMPTAQVDYADSVWCNRVVVAFERTLDYPTAYTIQINAGGWTTIATSPSIAADGEVSVYRVGGSWTTTAPASPVLSDAIQITGIRIVPTAMNRPDAYLSVIEISPRVQVDVTAYLQSYSMEENISEDDPVRPVGVVSANSGSVTFNNNTNAFEPRLAVDGVISLSDVAKRFAEVSVYTTINSEKIKVMGMLVDKWNTVEGDVAEAETIDPAAPLQAQPCPDMVANNATPSTAILRLLDRAGFSKVKFRKLSSVTEPTIEWYYCNKDMNVWEAVQEICRAYQYSAYFDADGYLNVATNTWMFGRTTPTWTFLGQNVSSDLADIMNHSESVEESINKAVIKFTPVGVSKSNDPDSTVKRTSSTVAVNRVATRTLYSPEKGILLGAAYLTKSMTDSVTYCYIPNSSLNDLRWGSFSGYFLVDQEIIKFDGLEYSCVDSSGTPFTVTVKDSSELSEVYSRAVGKVQFTGRLMNLERGQFGTTPAAHGFSKASWAIESSKSKYVNILADSTKNNRRLVFHNTSAASTVRTTATKNLGAAYNRFSFDMNIQKLGNDSRAGIMISSTVNGSNTVTSGYVITFDAKPSAANKNIIISRIGGSPAASIQTFDAPITYDTDEHITVVAYFNKSGKDKIRVVGSGFDVTASFPANKITYTNSVTLFSTGKTRVFFDALGAGNGSINSGITSRNQALSNVLEGNMGLVKSTPGYYETFGDLATEIFVDTVRFSKGPALNIKWYPTVNAAIGDTSKTQKVAKTTDLSYGISSPTPFSARLAIANRSTQAKLLDELDSGLYPLVYGNIVEEFEQIEVTVKNDASIAQLGENKIEIDDRLITNRKAADDLGDWLVNRAGKREIHEIESFDNPLLEIGDIVQIDYDDKGLTTGVYYVVRSVSRSRSEGLDTNVVLVRV